MSRRASRLPHSHRGAARPGFDGGDLPREARHGEPGVLPRAGVVERPRDHHVQPVFDDGAQRQLVLRELGEAVRTRRRERRVLVNRVRRVGGRPAPTTRRARGTAGPCAAHAVEQVMRAERRWPADAVRRLATRHRRAARRPGGRCAPAASPRARLGTAAAGEHVHRLPGDVGGTGPGRRCPADARRRRGRVGQPVQQVAAGESGGAGDERGRRTPSTPRRDAQPYCDW